jgi:hypothetical protein
MMSTMRLRSQLPALPVMEEIGKITTNKRSACVHHTSLLQKYRN